MAPATCVEPLGARDVDAAMDRGDPGGAGKGHDDAGRAENRQAADNARAGRSACARRSSRRREWKFRHDVGARAPSRLASADHRARRRIDRGLADAAAAGRAASPCRRPRRRERPRPRRARRGARSRSPGAVGHVGIVAGVLDHAGPRVALAALVRAPARRPGAGRRAAGSSTGSGKAPPVSAVQAARAAAVAQAPVVQPRRSGRLSLIGFRHGQRLSA